jgi:hypothetical protein
MSQRLRSRRCSSFQPSKRSAACTCWSYLGRFFLLLFVSDEARGVIGNPCCRWVSSRGRAPLPKRDSAELGSSCIQGRAYKRPCGPRYSRPCSGRKSRLRPCSSRPGALWRRTSCSVSGVHSCSFVWHKTGAARCTRGKVKEGRRRLSLRSPQRPLEAAQQARQAQGRTNPFQAVLGPSEPF